MSEQFESPEQTTDVEGHRKSGRDEGVQLPVEDDALLRDEEDDVEGHLKMSRDETSVEDEGSEGRFGKAT